MPRMDRIGHREKGDTKAWKGEDLLVVLVGEEETPVATAMKEKLKVVDLKEAYGDKATVYLWNKNLQSLPRRNTGGIVWIEALEVVAVVIDHRYGVSAYVMVLHPKAQFRKKLVVDMRGQGCFLDVVLGCPPLPFNQRGSVNEELVWKAKW